MNYLAHALLSPNDPLILMGNLWGDLIKPRDYPGLDTEILAGVELHKRIDAFTDQHAAVAEIMHLLRPYQGKYTPVVTDVLMDHVLSSYWSQFHHEPLNAFCLRQYSRVERYLTNVPERLHSRISRMLGHRWLESCAGRERMGRTLVMLSQRASFANRIPEAMLPYDLYQDKIDLLFLAFFSELQSYINLQNAH